MKIRVSLRAAVMLYALSMGAAVPAAQPLQLVVNWDKASGELKTTPTFLFVPNPSVRKPSPVRDAAFETLRAFQGSRVKYLAWNAYPLLAVAELDPPARGKTSWDFSQIDSVMIPFLEATRGKSPIISFSTIPTWMFKTPKPVPYPSDPDKLDFEYSAPPVLLDPTGKQIGDYHARLASWYTQGGFTDESGRYRKSGYHYPLSWWGVFNEPEEERYTTPEDYTRRYDAIVSAVRKVDPKMKFAALSLCGKLCGTGPRYFEYFLDPKNHMPGIPIDMISYHQYVHVHESSSVTEWRRLVFQGANDFLVDVGYIEAIRKRLSPHTQVNIDELGLRLLTDDAGGNPKYIPDIYWNLGAAFDTYLFIELAKLGIDVVTASHFIAYDDFTPSESMMDWRSGKPNARYHARQLLNKHFKSGDALIKTRIHGPSTQGFQQLFQVDELPETRSLHPWALAAQAVRTAQGRKILLVNKLKDAVDVDLGPMGQAARMEVVDGKSGYEPARTVPVQGSRVHLEPFAIAVITLQ